MGKRGPAGAPTALRVLRGDRADRINTDEPRPSAGVVEPPSWLTQRAKYVWAKLGPDLQARCVLTPWDVEAFAAFCDAAVRRRDAVAELRKTGAVMELPVFNKNGERTGERIGKSPWTLVLNEADAQFRYYAARFGLTPSDRAQLRMGEAPNGADELLDDFG